MFRWIKLGIVVALIGFISFEVFHWTVNRVYVKPGESLMLRYKGPLIFHVGKKEAAPGQWANEGEVGVLKELRGVGRHFYCPIWWERTIVKDVIIRPGEVGLVTCKLGDELPAGEFMVDGDIGTTTKKGILRKVLHPAHYRINPYGYEVQIVGTQEFTSGNGKKRAGWVNIPTGHVGVVTQMAANPAKSIAIGVQDNVLPPGIYPINGREQQIDVVEIGYRYTTVQAERLLDDNGKTKVDESGEPLIAAGAQGIEFPSDDGFPIHMDFTAIWGLMPDQAPHAVRTYGNVDAVENKIVQPQIESICRNSGSKYTVEELLIGTSREKFQTSLLGKFHEVFDAKQITLLYGLVRHIYIPQVARKPIQDAFIADELTLTRQTEQQTAVAEANFEEAKNQVILATETVDVDTTKQVEEKQANGIRQSEQIRAQTVRFVAEIEKETAALEAQAVEILGQAKNSAKQLLEEARADKFRLAVEAFGSAEAYNNFVFASGLPESVELKLLYAGKGTLWTDLNNLSVIVNDEQPPQPKK